MEQPRELDSSNGKLVEIEDRLKVAKRRIVELWVERGTTDPEVLRIGDEVDRLLNQYNQILNENSYYIKKEL